MSAWAKMIPSKNKCFLVVRLATEYLPASQINMGCDNNKLNLQPLVTSFVMPTFIQNKRKKNLGWKIGYEYFGRPKNTPELIIESH
jgi:hypothetical protein